MDCFSPSLTTVSKNDEKLVSALASISLEDKDPLPQVQHHCQKCVTSRPERFALYRLLHKLPVELRFMIIEYAVIETPCTKHIFAKCSDTWSCKKESHDQTDVIPSPCIASLCSCMSEEARKQFYRKSVIVFDRTPFDFGCSRLPTGRRGIIMNSAVPRAMPILHYFPLDSKQARHYVREHEYYEAYLYAHTRRHEIRHLVLKTFADPERPAIDDWCWVVNIDWEGLPNLETLVLDLRTVTLQYLQGGTRVNSRMLKGIVFRMRSLKLKRLVLVRLRSGLFSTNSLDKPRGWNRWMKRLFKPLMAKYGKLKYIDWDDYEKWRVLHMVRVLYLEEMDIV